MDNLKSHNSEPVLKSQAYGINNVLLYICIWNDMVTTES